MNLTYFNCHTKKKKSEVLMQIVSETISFFISMYYNLNFLLLETIYPFKKMYFFKKISS